MNKPAETNAAPVRMQRVPATFAQQRLWFLEQLKPGNLAYLIAWKIRLSGDLNPDALERTLNEIVRRHKVFRTTFAELQSNVFQVVSSALTIPLNFVDLRAERDAEGAAERIAQEEAQRPLDLVHGPLLRATLVCLGEREHLLLLTLHHIIFDGSSRSIFLSELSTIYAAFRDGLPSPLPEPKVQYADYAVWQRRTLQGKRYEKLIGYWKKQLADAPTALDLPLDHPRPAIEEFRGATKHFQLPLELAAKLKALARQRGASLFMVLMAGFQTLLSKYSGQDDILVGIPVAGRTHTEFEKLIGFFANQLVLRLNFSGNPSFNQLIDQMKNVSFDAFEHQEMPFDLLVQELNPERTLSHNPLFQVVFSLRNFQQPELRFAGVEKVEFAAISGEAAKVDLSMFVTEQGDEITGRLEYNTDLFDASTVARMLEHYRVLLERVLELPDASLTDIEILGAHERQQLLVEWNGTASDYPRNLCLHEVFEQQAERRGDATAILFLDERLSYCELNARANRLARVLCERGAAPGQRIGLFLERSLDMMVALLAVQKSGAAYIPLDPAYPTERVRATLEAADISLLVTKESLLETLPEYVGSTLCLDRDGLEIAAQSAANLTNRAQPGGPLYVIFTSGSTGKPKGVEVGHRNVVNLLAWMQRELNFGDGDVFPALASFAFDMSVPELYLALFSGGAVALGEKHLPGDGEELAAFLRRHRATLVHATPTTWGLLLEAGFTGAGLKRCIGAEPLPHELFTRLMEAAPGTPLYNFYGPTETTVWSTFHRFDSSDEQIVIGRPLANTQLYIFDAADKPVPIGVRGELLIGGDGVARGYFKQRELTAEKFIANPFGGSEGGRLYRTGDLARYLPDGRVEFAGRIDHQVKIRGYRIELGEIETVLAKHPTVRECVVMARQDVRGDKRLVGYVVGEPGFSVDVAELRQWVNERLPEYMVPPAIIVLERMPLSPNGKVDRKGLPAPEYGSGSAEIERKANPVEEIIGNIWAEVLRAPRIGLDDNFFALGGHSLTGTQVISRIRNTFHVAMPLRALFKTPTVAGLAQAVAALLKQDGGTSLPPLQRAERNAPLPLSFAQQRLWFLDQLEPNNPLYNAPSIMRLTGPLEVEILERALVVIAHRHETLRTRFDMLDAEPIQVIETEAAVELNVIDIGNLAGEERLAEAKRLAVDVSAQPFDLKVGSLSRTTVIRLAADDHVVVLNTHHAISDGWSLEIFWRELAAVYEAAAIGNTAVLPELPIQYADYAIWQRKFLAGDEQNRQLEYWKRQLAGAPPVLELPTDRQRPKVESFKGDRYYAHLPGDLLKALRELSQREGVTLFMTLLAAWDVLMARYSGQQDLVVGSPISGRNYPEVENLIGLFVNTLVLRTNLEGDPTFRELLGRVRETTLGAFGHQDVPFERLVEELQPERDLSRNPLFQVMLVLINVPATERRLGEATAVPFPVQKQSSKFDLSLYVAEQGDGLRTSFEYNTDLFDADTIQRMWRHFGAILDEVVKEPGLQVSRIPMLTEEEEQQQLMTWNDTRREYPRDLKLAQVFERQAERSPDSRACVSGDDSLTYTELNERSNQLAHYLMARDVRAGELVGVCLSRTNDLLVALLGIMKSGAAYLPLDPHYPQERLSYILEDAKTRLVLTEESVREMVPAFDGEAFCMDSHWPEIAGHSTANPPTMGGPEDLAYVLHTSGSTGKPKGVEITHRNLVNFLWTMREEPGLTADDTLLAVTTLSFDISGLELYLPLVTGACVVIASRPETMDAGELMRLMSRWGVSVMQATPATWQMLLEAGWKGDPGLKILCGGEALPHDLAAKLVTSCRELWNMYGPTETTIWSSVSRIEAANVGRISVGRPIANTTMYVLDEKRQLVPVGVAGELYIGGDGVGRGYWGKPELTAERFVADPFAPGMRQYRTGDLAKFLPDGTILVLGRIDFQVKVRGHRIELGEIETVLAQNDAVVECVVVVREDVPGDKRLVGYVVGRADVATADLRRRVAERLPEYMVPSAIVLLDALPRTANGKIDRKALPAPDVQESGPAYVAPRGLTEEIVCEIWAEVLKLERVGAQDNFFHLGGHSLLATRAIARIRQAMSVEVPLAALFESPTVSGLAERIAAMSRDGSGRAVPKMLKVAEGVSTSLSYAQQRLWFLDQFEPDSASYNVPWAVRLKGALDEGALRRALAELMARHETLRTSFAVDAVGGEPVQLVSEEPELPLTTVGLGALPEKDRLGEAVRLVREEARRPFRLAVAPLFRASLVRLDEQDHVLLVTLHHAISDGWSLGVLADELAALYEAFRAGEPSPLTPLALQYRDFSAWQREYLAGGALEEQLDYWTRHLAGAPPSIELPTDRPRPSVMTFEGAKRVAFVPAETLAGLKALGRKEGATLFITLLAAFDVMLSRYSGQQDLVIGTAIAGRETPETERLIGFFANTLPLRADLSGEPTFVELLRRVRATTLASYAHASLPFEKLVEELNPVRDMSRSPVFQVMFVQQNAFERSARFGSLAAEAFAAAELDSKMDLVLNVSERDGEIRCAIDYNTALYDAETIDRMLGHYGRLLERVVENSTLDVTEVSFLSEDEPERLLVEWNQTDFDYPRDKCLQQLFEEQVVLTPDRLAVTAADNTFTYAQLNEHANRLSHLLIARGVGAGSLVGVCLNRSEELLIALLGVLKTGAAYLPLDPAYPVERLDYIVQDAQARLIITEQAVLGSVPSFEGDALCLDTLADELRSSPIHNPRMAADPESLAYVLHTSGSTGKPKGVEITQRNLVNFLCSMKQEPGIAADDTLLAVTTLSFDISGLELYLPLITGANVAIATRDQVVDAAELIKLMERHQVSIMQATPATWRMLLEGGWKGDPKLKILCGGEAMPTELAAQLEPICRELWNMYGPTETTIWSAVARIAAGIGQKITIGHPIANTQLHLLDANRNLVPVGVIGELYIGGDGVGRGYWGKPELTAERFVADPFNPAPETRMFRTGDMGRRLSDGRIDFLGRADHQVKIRGFRIELGEIETVISQHPEVRECVVIAREDEPGNRFLAAYVVPVRGDDPMDIPGLRAHLREHVPEYMVPQGWMQMERLPLAATGKVDRRNLPVPLTPEAQSGSEDGRLRTPIEDLVAAVFSDVLKLESIGLEDNFFEFGGHSLSATQVMARLRHALGLEVPLRTLFEAPTTAGLAARLARMQRSELGLVAPPIVPVPRDHPLVLSFAQQRLWFIAQMDPGNPLYNAPRAIRMKGRLNVGAFESALRALVQRHEVLRTTFAVGDDDEPVQVIAGEAHLTLPLIDLSALPEDEREAQALTMLEVEAQKPFDLASDAMLRALLVRLGEDEHILLLNTHHIATDGWSGAVLMRDLTALYAVALGLDAPSLPTLPIQYADYAVWQRAWLRGEVLEQQLAFWRQKLAGAPPILQVPTDRPRPTAQTYSGGLYSFEVPAELMESLRKLGRREGSTSFMLLLTAFNTLIYYLLKQPDIVLGTDLANRTTVQTEDLIGFFVNLLVLRTQLSDDLTFREMLARVRANTLDAYAHQDVPFDKLVEELQPERSHSHNPLVQVLFVQQNTPRSTASMEGLEMSGVRLAAPSKFDMAVFVRETDYGLAGIWQYNSDLFDPATIEQMASLYLVVLRQVAADAEIEIGAIINLLADAQLQSAASVYEESREASRSKLRKTRRAAVSI